MHASIQAIGSASTHKHFFKSPRHLENEIKTHEILGLQKLWNLIWGNIYWQSNVSISFSQYGFLEEAKEKWIDSLNPT